MLEVPSKHSGPCQSCRPTTQIVVLMCPSFYRLLECMAHGHARCCRCGCRCGCTWPYLLLWLRLRLWPYLRHFPQNFRGCCCAHVRGCAHRSRLPWPSAPVAGCGLWLAVSCMWLAMSCGCACGLASPLASAPHLRSHRSGLTADFCRCQPGGR